MSTHTCIGVSCGVSEWNVRPTVCSGTLFLMRQSVPLSGATDCQSHVSGETLRVVGLPQDVVTVLVHAFVNVV